jgi:hypothetical protein
MLPSGAGDALGGLRLDGARERAGRLERGGLLLRLGQPGGELGGLGRVLRRGGHGQERAAPVGGSAGEDVREVPAGRGVAARGLGAALHVAEHPRGAHERGEGAVGEGLAPAPVPRGLRVGEAGLGAVGDLGPERLEVGVALDVELPVLRVVALGLLVHHGVPDEAGLVVPGLARRGLVLLADLEEAVPGGVLAAEEGRDLGALGGEARLAEELRVVAEALGPDVGAVADDPALGVRGLVVLPGDPAVLDVLDAVVAEVRERVGDLHDLAQPALLDRLHVGEAGAGRLLGLPVDERVAARVDVRGLDGHAGVRLLVLVVEVVEAHLVEGGHGEGDVLAACRAVRRAGGASGREEGDHRGPGDAGGRARSCCVRQRSLPCACRASVLPL